MGCTPEYETRGERPAWVRGSCGLPCRLLCGRNASRYPRGFIKNAPTLFVGTYPYQSVLRCSHLCSVRCTLVEKIAIMLVFGRVYASTRSALSLLVGYRPKDRPDRLDSQRKIPPARAAAVYASRREVSPPPGLAFEARRRVNCA